ncbi:hypothetical protein PSHT_03713 [Puccinia striiformis]|uniref:DDE Tnp4 domain-containing protein n=1 Tax=Puccinia striiformis TaxID=27350 RepID=A0A2S4WEY1_9BASI|nr:hypothetical protein PSHT_03713 [Puccinia striiformis]
MVRTSQRQQLIAALEKSIESELVAKALKPALECDEGSSSASLDTDARDDREEDEEMALLDLEVKAKALLFFRMSRTSFFQLCKQVEDDPVFHNNSNRPQRPVIEQDGDTAPFGHFWKWGLRWHVTWPNARARSDISQDFKEVGFDGCVGLIDGAWLDSLPAPRKMGQITIVRLMANCALTTSPTDYFSEGQYLLADSAFLPMENVVPAYRRQRHQPLTDEQNDFNRHLSGMRVAIENCIGLWKNRFQSLRGLRLRIANKQDMVRATAWIMACAVLHNYLNQGEDFEFEQEGSTADEAEVPLSATDNPPAGAASTAGTQKQLRVLMQARGLDKRTTSPPTHTHPPAPC